VMSDDDDMERGKKSLQLHHGGDDAENSVPFRENANHAATVETL
jgi:hypothetical protein